MRGRLARGDCGGRTAIGVLASTVVACGAGSSSSRICCSQQPRRVGALTRSARCASVGSSLRSSLSTSSTSALWACTCGIHGTIARCAVQTAREVQSGRDGTPRASPDARCGGRCRCRHGCRVRASWNGLSVHRFEFVLQKQNTKESNKQRPGHRLSPRGLGRPSGGGSLGPRAEEGGRQVEVWLSARQRNPCATDTPHNAAHRRAHADKKRNKPPTPYKQKITTQTGVLRIALTVAGRTEHSWSCFALAPLPSPGLQIIEEVVSVSV